jgi:hypothetical protein
MDAEIPQQAPLPEWDFWRQGMDRQFLVRVYRWASILGVIATLIFLGFEQRTAALGMLCGVATGLFSLWTVEVTVRLLFNGGQFGGIKLLVAALVKMPFALAGLFAIAWAGNSGIMSIFTVILGVLLVHGTMLVMIISTGLSQQDRNRERYR